MTRRIVPLFPDIDGAGILTSNPYPTEWYSDYAYRKEIPIVSPLQTTPGIGRGGYCLRLGVYPDAGDAEVGDVRMDGHGLSTFPRDIKFVDTYGFVCPHYVVSEISSLPAGVVVFVKVRREVVVQHRVIYMYYGKAGASEESNPNIFKSNTTFDLTAPAVITLPEFPGKFNAVTMYIRTMTPAVFFVLDRSPYNGSKALSLFLNLEQTPGYQVCQVGVIQQGYPLPVAKRLITDVGESSTAFDFPPNGQFTLDPAVLKIWVTPDNEEAHPRYIGRIIYRDFTSPEPYFDSALAEEAKP